MRPSIIALLLAACTAGTAAAAPDPLTAPIASPYAAQWLRPVAPVRIHGNTWYVGFGGLAIVLIDTGAGLILVDGALPQSVAALEANMRQLGFDVKDVRAILNTEAHFDHAGGIAALARASGALTFASAAGADALRRGHVRADDPQAGAIDPFPAVGNVRVLADGATYTLGNTTVTAHATPGHTPGSMSWTWPSCDAHGCVDVVFGASLNAVSSDTYQFSAPANAAALAAFRDGIAAFARLPCAILVTAHPDHSGFDDKLRRLEAAPASQPFIDGQDCGRYAVKYGARLLDRLAREAATR